MRLQINLENCYGISSLHDTIDLTENKSSIIYAANGTMKTSLAKTFLDYARSEETFDRVNPASITLRKFNLGNEVLQASQLFVIKSYEESFESKSISSLLINKELKKTYEDITKAITEIKDSFMIQIAKVSGIKHKEIENVIHELNGIIGTNIYDTLMLFRDLVESEGIPNKENFAEVNYSTIFNEKVQRILQDNNLKTNLEEYIAIYNNLINNSHFFKNTFAPYNAESVAKNLKDNGYFDANHSINVVINNRKIEINDINSLTDAIKEEKENILSDEKLVAVFEKIEAMLNKNNETRIFRDYIKNNKFIIPALSNLESLKKTLFASYFIKNKEIYLDLTDKYKNTRQQTNEIINKAKEEQKKWKKVIDIFNSRFFVPFSLKVSNQDDVILKGSAPHISFKYDNYDIDKERLIDVLSTGEKRALYLLNIIFEIEARKDLNQETLFIMDDIADSFDYKNKYAIVQYIKELTEVDGFYTIILTHNFDFFRTVQNRISIHRNNCFHAVKDDNRSIKLKKMAYINNPVTYWTDKLKEKKYLIPLIPFARNIIEYTRGDTDDDYIKLTSLLHFKTDTQNITVGELLNILKNTFTKIDQNLSICGSEETAVIDFIFEVTDDIVLNQKNIELDDKIILSIAIRLNAEKYLINYLQPVEEIVKNQLYELYSMYSQHDNKNEENMSIISDVLLMTPEIIHVNSFMYEPIIDLSPDHLIRLYLRTKNLQ